MRGAISESGGNSSLARERWAPLPQLSGGQGVHREVESEGHEENYRAVINGGCPNDEPVGQRWGKVEPALWRRRRSHSPTAPRCLRTARYGRTRRDLRRTGRVSEWHRSKRTDKRKRNGERRSVSSRTAEQYLRSAVKAARPSNRRPEWVGEGSRRRWSGREGKPDE